MTIEARPIHILPWAAGNALLWTFSLVALSDANVTALIQAAGLVIATSITAISAYLAIKVNRDRNRKKDDGDDDDS